MSKLKSDGLMLNAPIIPIRKSSSAFLSPDDLPLAGNPIKLDDDTKQFVERKELLISDYEYSRNGANPGLVLIFNQENFKVQKYRQGSRRDVNEIITCMTRLGYNINENMVFHDLDYKSTQDVIQKLTSQNLSAVNSLIVFFLTHGGLLNRLYVSDDDVTNETIWKPFVECKTLKDKPKIFIFQACKGNDMNTLDKKVATTDLVPPFTFQSDKLHPDMFVAFSTTEGHLSFRDPRRGTWFIQELCKTLTAYGRRDDIVALFIRITKCVATNYYTYEEDKDYNTSVAKQLPIFVSTLSKKFYLNRNKDRDVILNICKNQQELERKINELSNRVEKLLPAKKVS